MSIGCRLIAVEDNARSITIPVAFLYPATDAGTPQRYGPYTIRAAVDAPVIGQHLPLVVFSHGSGGSPWTYRETAEHLARAGFVVALPMHPGNNREDNSLAGTVANLQNRPRHISLAIDAALGASKIGSHLASDRIAVIGHSIGGYTALAVAGGRAWAGEHETPDGKPRPVELQPDYRVRALVLLAPATFWFIPGNALEDVRVPVLMWTGDQDEITPGWHADLVRRGVGDPALVEHRIIQGAGHFSFMSKFPAAMTGPISHPRRIPTVSIGTNSSRSCRPELSTFSVAHLPADLWPAKAASVPSLTLLPQAPGETATVVAGSPSNNLW